jgi:prepilin-type N-terminal cleavage/methylation domain-containing protein
MRSARGFTLTELAVVMTVVALLLASLMFTFSAQTEQRSIEETRRRLDQARDLLLSYAIVNGRLPCPARSAATATPSTVAGDEVRNAAMQCSGDHGSGAVEDFYGGTSGGVMLGLLPARTIGYTQVDASGFAVDAWNNRIRYAVSKSVTACAGAATNPHWVSNTNLKANGIACQPSDLLVCKSATGITATTCGGAANQIMSQNLVVAIVYSTGKNGSTPGAGAGVDEAANLNGDPVFVFHSRTDATFANGEFDDQMTWITAGEVYSKLIAAGVLP